MSPAQSKEREKKKSRRVRTVLDMELDRGTVGGLGQPHVKILTLSDLEKDAVVAVVELGQLVDDVKF